ncbi:hypothetical protein CKO11_05250 [Rhodobacter sp. TJ_12]|uniref:hypothetical protein n=1 Tax=Rhodobacter sp. TJ_12 TaxID=2029399 RepID=UPI001CBDE721|nr:hypothetical protein [Rhodobacter sp. TJ_12]MBZ4021866.1 hypothetical protein [Rhodobacter sp. TJ_12]
MNLTEADPKGLIRESYRIEGISDAECRSIFTDWALSLPMGADQAAAMRTVMAAYAGAPDHPMTALLTEGLSRAQPKPARRGGRAGRGAPV